MTCSPRSSATPRESTRGSVPDRRGERYLLQAIGGLQADAVMPAVETAAARPSRRGRRHMRTDRCARAPTCFLRRGQRLVLEQGGPHGFLGFGRMGRRTFAAVGARADQRPNTNDVDKVASPDREVDQLTKLITQVKRSISRLIDAYGDGPAREVRIRCRGWLRHVNASRGWRASGTKRPRKKAKSLNCGY